MFANGARDWASAMNFRRRILSGRMALLSARSALCGKGLRQFAKMRDGRSQCGLSAFALLYMCSIVWLLARTMPLLTKNGTWSPFPSCDECNTSASLAASAMHLFRRTCGPRVLTRPASAFISATRRSPRPMCSWSSPRARPLWRRLLCLMKPKLSLKIRTFSRDCVGCRTRLA